jgi:hypothetical protein
MASDFQSDACDTPDAFPRLFMGIATLTDLQICQRRSNLNRIGRLMP